MAMMAMTTSNSIKVKAEPAPAMQWLGRNTVNVVHAIHGDVTL